MSQTVGSGSQYNPNIYVSPLKANKPAAGQESPQTSLEGVTSLVGEKAILQTPNQDGISIMPGRIVASMAEATVDVKKKASSAGSLAIPEIVSAKILIDMAVGRPGLILDYLNNPDLPSEEKARLLSELVAEHPEVILSSLNDITLQPDEKAILLKEAEVSQKRIKAFGLHFTEDKQQAAVEYGISRETVDKAILVALRAMKKGLLQGAIYDFQDNFIISPGKDSDFPEITFKATCIGKGSFGAAYKVFRMSTGLVYAIKEARIDLSKYRRRAIKDVLNEVRILELIGDVEGLQKPPHEVVDFRSQEGTRRVGYIGQLYSGNMKVVRPENPEQRVKVARQLLSGLKALHDEGIRHGDIKPSNIFMNDPKHARSGGYEAYIADLGGARSFKKLRVIFDKCLRTPLSESLIDIAFSLFGVHTDLFIALNSMGLPLDMLAIVGALEEKNFDKYKDVEKACDVYALGLSLIYTFTGKNRSKDRLPKDLKTPLAVSGMSPGQIDIIIRMVSNNWEDRPSVDEALQAFQ